MSSMVFRETMQAHLITRGNAYAEIVPDGAGRVAELWPIHPANVSWDRDKSDNLFYRVYNHDGTTTTLRRDQMFHLRGLGGDGVWGYSVIRMARESLGLTKATEMFGATFFGNGAKPGGVLEHPARLSQKVKDELRENVQAIHGGPEHANKLAIFEEGMKYHQISIPPEDAQFLQTRVHQVVEVARWLNISPTKLRDLSRSTFSNAEQETLDFVMFTLRPWLRRWKAEILRSLISPLERTQQFAQHVIEELLSADIASRYNAYAVGREKG
jgi:HK97 family phage portal protein